MLIMMSRSTTADAMRHDAYNRWWRRDMLSGRVTTCADSVVSQLATAWLKDLSKISQACQTYEKNEAGLSFEGYLRELASCQHELTTCVKYVPRFLVIFGWSQDG